MGAWLDAINKALADQGATPLTMFMTRLEAYTLIVKALGNAALHADAARLCASDEYQLRWTRKAEVEVARAMELLGWVIVDASKQGVEPAE